MIIIYFLLGIVAIFELATFMTYGGFVSKDVTEIFMNLEEGELRLNQFDPSILSTRHYVAHIPFSTFSKYYINGFGTVPRWSKLHKRIKQYYIIAIKKSL